jgi:hypothetical protein
MKFELKLVDHPVTLCQRVLRLPAFIHHASNALCDEAQLNECNIPPGLEIAKVD